MRKAASSVQSANDETPRSRVNAEKTIKSQGYTVIKGTRYFKRVFDDGAVELVRFDLQANKWAILCFKS